MRRWPRWSARDYNARMIRRWLIRSIFIFLALLPMAGWVYSYRHALLAQHYGPSGLGVVCIQQGELLLGWLRFPIFPSGWEVQQFAGDGLRPAVYDLCIGIFWALWRGRIPSLKRAKFR